MSPETGVRVAVARAGNVIGGGDWAADRLIPDAVRAWVAERALSIRAPLATRPWQHVLEPLSGYLLLASELSVRDDLMGEPFNFGPHSEDLATVGEVVRIFGETLGDLNVMELEDSRADRFAEAGLLKLSCDKALSRLCWRPVLKLSEALSLTANWYQEYYVEPGDTNQLSESQLRYYCSLAEDRNLAWV